MLCTIARNAIMHRIVQWNAHLVKNPQGRRQKLSIAYLLDRIFFVLKSGCQWSMLPVSGSSYKTVYHYFNKWSKASIFENSFYDVVSKKKPLSSVLIVDTSFVKNALGKDVLGANPTDRGRKATKVSLLTDGQGAPLCSVFHKKNKIDGQTLRHLLKTAHEKSKIRNCYRALLADKEYDSDICRKL